MREYHLAALLAVPAVFAAAEPGRADTELPKLEDQVSAYAQQYYEETQKAGKSVREYSVIRDDIERILNGSGVRVERDGSDYLIDGERILSVFLNEETGVVDVRLARLIVRQKKKIEIEGTSLDVDTYLLGDVAVDGYSNHTNKQQNYSESVDVRARRIYLFENSLRKRADVAWDIVQGKWDSPLLDIPENRGYRVFVDLTKFEFEDLKRLSERDFKSKAYDVKLQAAQLHGTGHIYFSTFMPADSLEHEEALCMALPLALGAVKTPSDALWGVFSDEASFEYKSGATFVHGIAPYLQLVVPSGVNPQDIPRELAFDMRDAQDFKGATESFIQQHRKKTEERNKKSEAFHK